MLGLLRAAAMLATSLLWLSSTLLALAKLPSSFSSRAVVVGAFSVFLSVSSATAVFSPECLPALSTKQNYRVKAQCMPKTKACHEFWPIATRRKHTTRDVSGATCLSQTSCKTLERPRLRAKEYVVRSRCPVVDIMNISRAMLLHYRVIVLYKAE